jgi:hypothetical protein
MSRSNLKNNQRAVKTEACLAGLPSISCAYCGQELDPLDVCCQVENQAPNPVDIIRKCVSCGLPVVVRISWQAVVEPQVATPEIAGILAGKAPQEKRLVRTAMDDARQQPLFDGAPTQRYREEWQSIEAREFE